MSKTGTVKFFNTDKGYGFIQPDDGSDDSFVHISAVQAAGMHTLDKEQRLNYEIETGRNGKASAVNLSAADYPPGSRGARPTGRRALPSLPPSSSGDAMAGQTYESIPRAEGARCRRPR